MHRNDEQIITNFPRNLLSSFYQQEVSVGMYTMWMIETTRLKEINSPDFYQFASLNPRIVKSSSGDLVDQNEILPEVAAAYNSWWNSSLSLEEKLETNPLESMDLAWN